MEKINIDFYNTNKGNISVTIPQQYSEYIGEDGFNYSNSTITGYQLDNNNNVINVIRWNSWSYPQYRYEVWNGNYQTYAYADLLRSGSTLSSNTYSFYGSDLSSLRNFQPGILLFIALVVGCIFALKFVSGGNN